MTSVLLAEDDLSISDPLARALRREGYDVDVSADGPSTLDAAMAGGLDLIVLDIGLPELDGLEVCRRIQARRPELAIDIMNADILDPQIQKRLDQAVASADLGVCAFARRSEDDSRDARFG